MNKYLFLIVLEVGSLISKCWQMQCLVKACFLVQNLMCLHMAERVREVFYMCAQLPSRVWLFPTSWTVAHQSPLSIRFSRQEFWSLVPFPTPGDLPDPGIEPESPSSPALAGGFFTIEPPGNLWRSSLGFFYKSTNLFHKGSTLIDLTTSPESLFLIPLG